tara:strand:+ start:248 stop:418 length:171 start_codon:yes stop_codon:yes gene_type:complete
MISLLKRVGLAYLAFGLGMLIGVTIASVIAAIMMIATLDPEQLERINEFSEEIKEE